MTRTRTRIRSRRAASAVALCCAVAGVGLVGCDEDGANGADASGSPSADSNDNTRKDRETGKDSDGQADADTKTFEGTRKIRVDGRSVNVSCSGKPADGRPVVVLLHGGGHDVTKMAEFQKSLGAKQRTCSYDRPGAGASAKPVGRQSLADSGKVLTGVLDAVAGDNPVVLAGHSLGGVIAARYAPDHGDRVKGLVLMDATSPTQGADLTRDVPKSAEGQTAQLRDQTIAALEGQNPERLVVPDGEVRSAGNIPVEVVQHGVRHLAEFPEHGEAMERSWAEGQKKWLALSSASKLRTATKSAHDIYLDEPAVPAASITRVVAQVTDRG
ncbi:alpha/beta fold hydrolase [Streptomyces sp. XM4193]|uniref:alpha/beta fold hydrolase n=1 Tax=Streptomyces sp. XM4193 TaxID=2929782 RepID=UPI001FF7E320|nr:alpha/beta fold hydrolase [Streptomyces sp. XM4193]MCK1799131.1 alpha/beta fold hydrolase [Streptomyces sp. XM4193]